MLTTGAWIIWEKVLLPIFEMRADTDFLSGRESIWLSYLGALFRRTDILLLGTGAGNTIKLVKVIEVVEVASEKVAHNMYLEYLIQFGILGMILLIGIVVRMMRQNSYKMRTYFLLVLVAYSVTAFGISANSNDCIFAVMLFLVMPMYTDSDLNCKQSNEGEGNG